VPGNIYSLLLRGVRACSRHLAVIFVLTNRGPVGDWLRGRQPPGGRRIDDASAWLISTPPLSDIWHVLAITYIIGIYLVYALRVEGGFIFVCATTLLSVTVLLRLACGKPRQEEPAAAAFASAMISNRNSRRSEIRANPPADPDDDRRDIDLRFAFSPSCRPGTSAAFAPGSVRISGVV